MSDSTAARGGPGDRIRTGTPSHRGSPHAGMARPVVLDDSHEGVPASATAGVRAPGDLVELVCEARAETIPAALDLALALGAAHVFPGAGRTRELWQMLATVASIDLGAARAIEPHLDARAILEQAGMADVFAQRFGSETTWGVFAAEGGTEPLRARRTDGNWMLNGVKLWCSLADRLTAALVTAERDDGRRQLFAVRLGPGVHVQPGTWFARGLAEVPSGPVRFVDVEAFAVGEPGWYLSRPGFRLGAIGVAACWYGGAVAVARTLQMAARSELARVAEANGSRNSTDLMLAQLGAVDVALQQARRALLEASNAVDAAALSDRDASLLAARVRATVARAAEEVITRVGHALGPAPLALNEKHAKRVADLGLYIAQHHAERDDVSLGRTVAGVEEPW